MHRATAIIITLLLGLGAEGCKRCKYLHSGGSGEAISSPRVTVRDCTKDLTSCGPQDAAIWSQACRFGRQRDRAQARITKRLEEGKLVPERLQARYEDNRDEEESLLRVAASLGALGGPAGREEQGGTGGEETAATTNFSTGTPTPPVTADVQ